MAELPRVVLASASPRRRELLARLVPEFEVVSPDVDETPVAGETPRELVRRLASAKADAVAADVGDDVLVVAGDTVVAVDATILGKPADRAEAERMLWSLSGRTHEVVTGYALRHGDRHVVRAITVPVTMTQLPPSLVAWYLDTGEWQGKAGAYAIQGQGAVLVASITGDPTAVIGLPLHALTTDATTLGLQLPT